MKYSTVALAFLLIYSAISQPHWQRQHQHQRYHEKQDVWVDGDVMAASTFSTTQFPPTPSTSTAYVPHSATSSTYVALVVDTLTTPIYVPSNTTAATVQVTTAPSSLAPAPSLSSSGGPCTAGSPCVGELTYYIAGPGACGVTSDGNSELVVALPFELLGTLSNDNPYCGKTITIEHSGRSVVATVVDKCMGCYDCSLDLSIDAFSSLGIDLKIGRVTST